MNGKVIDSNFVLHVNPDWSYGRNHGFTDDETEKIADDTYFEMERFYEKYRPHKWPEEKPEHNKEYLIRTRDTCEHYDYVGYRIATWKEKLTASERQTTYGLERKGGFEPGFFEMDNNMYWFTVDKITHWWELPEVKE